MPIMTAQVTSFFAVGACHSRLTFDVNDSFHNCHVIFPYRSPLGQSMRTGFWPVQLLFFMCFGENVPIPQPILVLFLKLIFKPQLHGVFPHHCLHMSVMSRPLWKCCAMIKKPPAHACAQLVSFKFKYLNIWKLVYICIQWFSRTTKESTTC